MDIYRDHLEHSTGETMPRKSTLLACLGAILSIALPALTQPAPVAKHSFTAKDWATHYKRAPRSCKLRLLC